MLMQFGYICFYKGANSRFRLPAAELDAAALQSIDGAYKRACVKAKMPGQLRHNGILYETLVKL